MRARVEGYGDATAFYKAERMAANALLRFVERILAEAKAELARCGGRTEAGLLEREIASLERLRVGPPKTALDVMEFCYIYFVVSEYLDGFQVRSFGSIDSLWRAYYERDLREGRTTEAEFREDFRHFIWQFGSIDNYWGHPLCLGGTKADGTTEYNPLSLVLLDVVDREALPTPKIQLKIAKNTPEWLWDKALRMLRNHRSVVLMGEEGMARSMTKLGLTADECRRLVVWGCFEWLPPEGNCTSSCKIANKFISNISSIYIRENKNICLSI
jgi:formate C-acetyltransferase